MAVLVTVALLVRRVSVWHDAYEALPITQEELAAELASDQPTVVKL